MKTKRGALSLLLVLAMLTVALATFFPATVSADPEPEPEEIQDLGSQSSANFAVANATTEVRFVFTVGSLDYTNAGFVFSFESYGNVKTPTIGAAGCYTVPATAAYKTINADGKETPAPENRWWIAAKITNIPQDEFCGWIYLRAFVTDGAGTRYSDVVKTNPYDINRGDGEKVREAIGKSSTSSSAKLEDKRNIYTDVLQSGAKTFHPTQENSTGNDLHIEYSVLFNAQLNNLLASNDPYVASYIANSSMNKGKPIFYWSPCTDIPMSDNKDFPGGLEWFGNFVTLAEDDPGLYPNMVPPVGKTYGSFPNIGGTDSEHPEYGWHRIGIVYHEEVTNEAALREDETPGATPAQYYLTVSLYIDGTLVSVLCADDNMDGDFDLKLYTAQSDGHGGITYTDIASDRYVFIYRMKYKGSDSAQDKNTYAYCVFADAYATCGNSFVQTVEHVDLPMSSYYRASDEKGIFAPVYYRITN
ncbi:MAG: hypothetical protein J5958_07615 [Clostridia bacterium]|nr:hypothetical protein [Clostridia bacterium]